MDTPMILLTPITHAGIEYRELALSEPTADQLSAAEKVVGAIGSLTQLIHLNAAIPLGAARLLRQRDLQRAADFFGRFASMPTDSGASENSSPS